VKGLHYETSRGGDRKEQYKIRHSKDYYKQNLETTLSRERRSGLRVSRGRTSVGKSRISGDRGQGLLLKLCLLLES